MKQTKFLISLFILDLSVASLYFALTDYFAFTITVISLISLYSIAVILDGKRSESYEHGSLISFLLVANIITLIGPIIFIILGAIAFI